MLYYLFTWIRESFDTTGFGVFQYLTTRSAAAAITALIISLLFGQRLINMLKRMQMSEQAKTELQDIGLHLEKAGTPTMGGLIILLAILLPTILWADMSNMFVIMILIVTALMGGLGFLDDYLKVIKKYKKGLIGRYKIIGQITIGLILGGTIYFFPETFSSTFSEYNTLTTLPFAKDYNINFGIFYIPVVIFILTAMSNAVNITDGLDGLAIGTVGIAALALALIAYITGNSIYSDYLNIMYLENSGELVIFLSALIGAVLGFLWYNSHPAGVFMGDTGSLALGGALGALAILIKKEFLLPIVGGVFFAETISVIIQVTYFRYTRKKYGKGRRIFRVAPLHHHFEKLGWAEPKIVTRFYIIAVLLAIITMATFKIR
jgi:phospho-N-acetylmuramoyl-pentapeptide-transferase